MKITWLGQGGLLFEKDDYKIVIDPYLSDNVVTVNPKNYRRKPVDEKYLHIKPDVILITHNHLDHYDPVTLDYYMKNTDKNVEFIASFSSYNEGRKYGGDHNYILVHPQTEWTLKCGVKVTAVKAFHSEEYAVGYILEDGNKNYYITGDTLYNSEIFSFLPKDIYALFLPINGVGNNMNIKDAERFAKNVGARYTVPMHFGLFDNLDPKEFEGKNVIIPEYFKEIQF